jgi:glycosyltransferase involved in cell wall biosynthesis
MRIVYATDAWHPQISGVVKTAEKLVSLLKLQGHDVLVIEPNMFRTVATPGYKEIPFSVNTWKIGKMIDRFNPNAIHIATEGPIGFATLLSCKKRMYSFTTSYATHFADLLKAKYYIPTSWSWSFLRAFHNSATRTFVKTATIENQLHSVGITKTFKIGGAVDVNEFSPRFAKPLTYIQPIWLNVGRVSIEKNLKAFLDLDLPGTKVCVGRGPQLKEYMKKYPDVVWLGARTGIELAEIYASADVFVFPSKWDTFGLVLLEAMASGVPVAAYPVQGPIDVVSNGISGCLNEDLKKACFDALQLNNQGVWQYAQQFSWETLTTNFLSGLEILK